MTSSIGNIFRVTGHLCGEFTSEFPTAMQWREGLMFSLTCVWINGWVNNGEAGYLGRHRAHYDVTVMNYPYRSYWLSPFLSVKEVPFICRNKWCRPRQLIHHSINSFPPRQNGCQSGRQHFWMHFHQWKVLYFHQFHWNLFPRIQLVIIQHWFR